MDDDPETDRLLDIVANLAGRDAGERRKINMAARSLSERLADPTLLPRLDRARERKLLEGGALANIDDQRSRAAGVGSGG